MLELQKITIDDKEMFDRFLKRKCSRNSEFTFTNLFMYSASAKWMILAPIFVPMFLNLGINPVVTQCLYRMGDSCTNNLTPLNAALVYAITLMNQNRMPEINKEEAGMGTLLSGQVVFSLTYLVVLIALFCVFYFCGIPLGLGA